MISSIGINRHRKTQRLVAHRIREPFVVHFSDSIATGENKIDEELALASAVRLAEPVRKRELGGDPLFGEGADRPVPIGAPDEEVEILCVPADAGVVNECVRATDKKLDVGALKDLYDALVELECVPAGSLNGG